MSSLLAPDHLLALKTATRDLVKAVGNLERAAELTGRSTTQVARWYAARDETDPTKPSTTVIDAGSIAVLEADLADRGDPRRPVTECLARLGGRRLTDASGGAARASIARAAAELSGISGKLAAALMDALADGEVTATEAEISDRIARDLTEAVADLRRSLGSRMAGGVA